MTIQSQPQDRHLSRWSRVLLALYYFGCFVVCIALVHTLYNGGIHTHPGRIEATLAEWRQAPFWKHWFLFYLTPEDAQQGIPYGNMPYLFSFFYATYHLVINALTLGRWPFATTYLVTMIALWGGSWSILRPILADTALRNRIVMLPLAAGILVTSPYVSAFLLQSNHDTPFPLNAIAATVLAFAIVRRDDRAGPVVWMALGYSSISGLVGLVTLAACFLARRSIGVGPKAWLALFGFAIGSLLLPVLLAQAILGQNSGSGVLFRTGLDGSMQYLTGHWQALFQPHMQLRALDRELTIKLVVLLALLGTGWLRFRLVFWRELAAIGIALLPYLSHWIVFPQAISIHPYLYDMLFLVPLDLLVVAVMASTLARYKTLTDDISLAAVAAALALLLHDNLLLLAQGHFLPV